MRALTGALLAHARLSALAAVLPVAFASTTRPAVDGGAADACVDGCAPRSRTSECARCGAPRRLRLDHPAGGGGRGGYDSRVSTTRGLRTQPPDDLLRSDAPAVVD